MKGRQDSGAQSLESGSWDLESEVWILESGASHIFLWKELTEKLGDTERARDATKECQYIIKIELKCH